MDMMKKTERGLRGRAQRLPPPHRSVRVEKNEKIASRCLTATLWISELSDLCAFPAHLEKVLCIFLRNQRETWKILYLDRERDGKVKDRMDGYDETDEETWANPLKARSHQKPREPQTKIPFKK